MLDLFLQFPSIPRQHDLKAQGYYLSRPNSNVASNDKFLGEIPKNLGGFSDISEEVSDFSEAKAFTVRRINTLLRST
jgi:hypothetical protein